jgi:hypothetical protein
MPFVRNTLIFNSDIPRGFKRIGLVRIVIGVPEPDEGFPGPNVSNDMLGLQNHLDRE